MWTRRIALPASKNSMCCCRSRLIFSTAIEELIEDIEAGRKYMKTYKQMKMYNDPRSIPCFMPRKNKKLPRHLLVIRTSAMGDVAMLPHALRA